MTEQFEKLKNRLETLDSMNSSYTSTYRFKDVKLYEDDLENIFLYYVSINESDRVSEPCYVQFDKEGRETLLNNRFTSDELKDMFMTLKPFQR